MLRNRNASSLLARSSLRHILTPPWAKRQFYGSLKGDCVQPSWIQLTVRGKHCYETAFFVLPAFRRDRMLTCVYYWNNRTFTDFPCCSDDTSSIKGFRAIYQFSKFAGKQSIRKPTIGITPPMFSRHLGCPECLCTTLRLHSKPLSQPENSWSTP